MTSVTDITGEHIMRTQYWPKRVAMSVIAIGSAMLMGCTDKPGSAGWCQQMSAKTKSEWTGEDAKTFASHCVFESTTIGSESWCENLDDKPKGDWTTQEVADYAKYCVVSQVTQ